MYGSLFLLLNLDVFKKVNRSMTKKQKLRFIPFLGSDPIFVRIQNRDDVQAKLKEQGIPSAVHYPMPLYLQECFAYLRYDRGDFPVSEMVSDEIMSLPMNSYVTDDEIEYIYKRITI